MPRRSRRDWAAERAGWRPGRCSQPGRERPTGKAAPTPPVTAEVPPERLAAGLRPGPVLFPRALCRGAALPWPAPCVTVLVVAAGRAGWMRTTLAGLAAVSLTTVRPQTATTTIPIAMPATSSQRGRQLRGDGGLAPARSPGADRTGPLARAGSPMIVWVGGSAGADPMVWPPAGLRRMRGNLRPPFVRHTGLGPAVRSADAVRLRIRGEARSGFRLGPRAAPPG